jgi:hypothetical protein
LDDKFLLFEGSKEGAGGFKGVRTRDTRRGNETKSLEIEEKVEEEVEPVVKKDPDLQAPIAYCLCWHERYNKDLVEVEEA